MEIRLLISGLKVEMNMDYPAGPHMVTGSLKDGRGRQRMEEGWASERWGTRKWTSPEGGGRGRAKERSGLGSWRRAWIPWEASGDALCPHLDVSPEAPPDSRLEH